MPHITIEYSANVADHHDIQALVNTVHGAALDHGLPPLDGLRTRAVARTHYRIADGDSGHAFIAIHARIGPGRAAEEKRTFITAMLDAAEAEVGTEHGPLAIAWSVEVTELDADFRINRNHVRTSMQHKHPEDSP
jgi:5-carboxymethyl-2-hydroxymuconate isomerase